MIQGYFQKDSQRNGVSFEEYRNQKPSPERPGSQLGDTQALLVQVQSQQLLLQRTTDPILALPSSTMAATLVLDQSFSERASGSRTHTSSGRGLSTTSW